MLVGDFRRCANVHAFSRAQWVDAIIYQFLPGSGLGRCEARRVTRCFRFIRQRRFGGAIASRCASRLPQLKVALGDKLAVDVRAEGILLKPARHRYALDELVAQCDPNAPMPADLASWNSLTPVGREAWRGASSLIGATLCALI